MTGSLQIPLYSEYTKNVRQYFRYSMFPPENGGAVTFLEKNFQN